MDLGQSCASNPVDRVAPHEMAGSDDTVSAASDCTVAICGASDSAATGSDTAVVPVGLAGLVVPVQVVPAAVPDVPVVGGTILVKAARKEAVETFAVAALDAAGLLLADYPNCKRLAQSHDRLVTLCATGDEGKLALVKGFFTACSMLFDKVATACDDAVLDSVFGMAEAQAVDLRSKYFAYDAEGRACLVEHFKEMCRHATYIDFMNTTENMPAGLVDLANELSRGMASGTGMTDIFASLLPRAVQMVGSMSDTEQSSLVQLAAQSNTFLKNLSGMAASGGGGVGGSGSGGGGIDFGFGGAAGGTFDIAKMAEQAAQMMGSMR